MSNARAVMRSRSITSTPANVPFIRVQNLLRMQIGAGEESWLLLESCSEPLPGFCVTPSAPGPDEMPRQPSAPDCGRPPARSRSGPQPRCCRTPCIGTSPARTPTLMRSRMLRILRPLYKVNGIRHIHALVGLQALRIRACDEDLVTNKKAVLLLT